MVPHRLARESLIRPESPPEGEVSNGEKLAFATADAHDNKSEDHSKIPAVITSPSHNLIAVAPTARLEEEQRASLAGM
ncbi:hypothetical protein OPT61_g5751 [Boeremia exigua]|uniref:Uncharacterized protein n=1 Tax=Boeremia exigua TaxID=749465 RepID=A0ACC2I967_9PLEO|nr:hypothetical protein OPT61_g5751 [Boeremia exigua]